MISVVINTLNEEKNLPKAIASVKDLADEIVVCDMYSDDETIAIAKRAGAKVYEHKRMGYVEPARNYAIEKASGDWVLILDADETISSSLSTSLRKITENPKADYYAIPRKNIIFGKWIKHSRWWPDYNVRFFKKGSVIWNEEIHSIPFTKGKGADLPVDEKYTIIHNEYTSIEQFIERMNRYTKHQLLVLKRNGYKFVWKDLIKKPVGEFSSRYFYGEGYKDGVHGLALALLQAFSEITLYLKAWQEEKYTELNITPRQISEEIKVAQKEVNYWTADTLIKEGGGIVQRIKRKYKLN